MATVYRIHPAGILAVGKFAQGITAQNRGCVNRFDVIAAGAYADQNLRYSAPV